jgi:hypothetical protein
MKSFLMLVVLFCSSANAKITYELYADCANYCTFRDFPNNCHGIAFKSEKKGETDFHYTYFSKNLNACIHTRPPFINAISMHDVVSKCDCSHLPSLAALPPFESSMSDSTRAELVDLKNKISEWAPCATDPMKIVPIDAEGKFSSDDQGSCKYMKNGYMVLGGCEPGMHSDFCRFYGNTNNVAAPFCIAGDLDRCKDIALNHDPKTGAWYRSAFQRRDPLSERGQPLFSRDEFLGVMIYLAKTKDKESARRWMQFVEQNPKKYLTGTRKKIKAYNICPPLPVKERPSDISEKQWEDMQPDDRCEMRPNDWPMMYVVYKHIGFTDDELKTISKGIYYRMKLLNPFKGAISYGSALTVPARSYELALQATTVLLFREAGLNDNATLNATAKLINDRTARDNPYYHYLAMGNRATEYGAQLIKKFCSPDKPNYKNPPQGGYGRPAASFFDSGNHTFGGLNVGSEANLPIGHDCIAWINFYLNAVK